MACIQFERSLQFQLSVSLTFALLQLKLERHQLASLSSDVAGNKPTQRVIGLISESNLEQLVGGPEWKVHVPFLYGFASA